MPAFHHRLLAVVQELDDGMFLGEPLFFPEVSCLTSTVSRLRSKLRRRVSELLRETAAGEVYQRRLMGEPATGSVQVRVDPPASQIAWREPLPLTFPYVWWAHGSEAVLGFVPALGIEVLVEQERDLVPELRRQIRHALVRERVTQALRPLVWRHRCQRLSTEVLESTVIVPSPKQTAVNRMLHDERESSLLAEGVVRDLTKKTLAAAYGLDATVARLADALTGRRRASVLLVGPSGVGKTAALQELVRRREAFGVGGVLFWGTSGSRLVAGMSGFGMWQERCRQLVRQAAKSKAVVHVDHLVELTDVGKSVGNPLGIASFLQPHISRGELTVIAECTPEQVAVIEREDPQCLGAFQQIHLEEPSVDLGRDILVRFVLEFAGGQRTPLEAGVLETIDRLHRRYATYSACPGRPLRFLRNLLEDQGFGGRESRSATDLAGERPDLCSADVTAAFSRETGLPLFLLDEDTELRLDETRAWFAHRVLGQSSAVDLVVDLLATIKAGLSRPGRPIASLLFIGPTGVGKTEMAKALSEFMYRDPGRLIRLDMSEYADRMSLERLIGGAVSQRGLLTDGIRQQPFTVVLLDEFEKADPSFFDLLLQVLGEGRMTDGAGRVADFCNAIIVMTSNLGVDSFGRGRLGFGHDASDPDRAEQHFERKVREFVRPEFFNRIDRIVPFAPLDRDTIECVARRELAQVCNRNGLRFRDVTLDVHDDVVGFLADCGYEPRYGARPLKRSIEQRLVTPLSHQLNGYSSDAAVEVTARLKDGEIEIAVKAKQNDAGGTVSMFRSQGDWLRFLQQATELRRQTQALAGSHTTTQITNELYRVEQLLLRLQRSPTDLQPVRQAEQRAEALRELVHRIERLALEAANLEEESLLAFYERQPIDGTELGVRHELIGSELERLAQDLFLRGQPPSHGVCLAIYSLRPHWMFELARIYLNVTRRNSGRFEVYSLQVTRPDRKPDPVFRLLHRRIGPDQPQAAIVDVFRQPDADELFRAPPSDLLGVGLAIRGPWASALLGPEHGLHEFVQRNHSKESCLVDVAGESMFNYEPPHGIDRARFFRERICSQYPVRRRYHLSAEVVEDEALASRLRCEEKDRTTVVTQAIESLLHKSIRAIMEPWT